MKRIELKRLIKTDDYTTGEIYTFSDSKVQRICATIELPDRNNARRISCIPAGKYIVKKHNSPKFGKCLKVFDIDGKSEVSGRSDILIHAGNYISDTLGCILPVQMVSEKHSGGIFGNNSAAQLQKLLYFVGNDAVELEICRKV